MNQIVEEEKRIDTIALENNLTLCFYDISRKIAAGRWLVKLLAKVEIPVSKIQNTDGISMDDIQNALGDAVVFEQKRERNFIGEEEKEEVLKNLCVSFSDTLVPYLSHPDFPRRFVLKKYKEYTGKKQLYKAMGA